MKNFRMKLTKIQAADRGVNLCLTRWSLTHDTTEWPLCHYGFLNCPTFLLSWNFHSVSGSSPCCTSASRLLSHPFGFLETSSLPAP